MLTDLRKALVVLDPATRSSLPLLLAGFALLAVLDALSIGLLFPLMLAIVAPERAGEGQFADWVAGLPLVGATHPALPLGVLAASLFIGKNVAAALLVRRQYRLLSAAEARVGTRLFESYLTRPWRSTRDRNSAEMIRNASVATSHLFLSYLIPMMTLVVEALLVSAVIAVLLWIDAAVATSAFLLLLCAGVAYFLAVRRHLADVGRDFQKANLDLLTHLKQGLGAAREIRVLGREARFVEEVAAARDLYAAAQARRATFTLLPRYFLEVVLVAAVLGAVAVTLPQRGGVETSAVIALFGVAALRLMTSANRILGAVQQVRMGLEPLRLVHDDLCDTPEPGAPPSAGDRPSIGHSATAGLEFREVSFAHESGRPALDHVSFSLGWADSLGILGPSGSGKSTLVDVLLGLLPPDRGAVLCDGRNIAQDISGWQRRIGLVPQSIYLTDDTLRANVAFGLPPEAIDETAVRRALEMAQLSNLVATLPDGLETRIGDLGGRLSGGQRQRVGIARALYHDPDILVLDEATSALDAETEAFVVEAIEHLARRKTLIVVAHRISTLRNCRRLLVLEEGRVTGLGSFDDLLDGNDTLRRMVRQSGSPF